MFQLFGERLRYCLEVLGLLLGTGMIVLLLNVIMDLIGIPYEVEGVVSWIVFTLIVISGIIHMVWKGWGVGRLLKIHE